MTIAEARARAFKDAARTRINILRAKDRNAKESDLKALYAKEEYHELVYQALVAYEKGDTNRV